MRRISPFTRLAPIACLAFLFFSSAASAQQEQDDALRDEVIKIGQVTGDDAFAAQLQDLLKDKDRSKKLVAAAVRAVNAREGEVGYYGALTLGQLAAELKDYKSCETLFRVAMVKSVQLYSTSKILQSYGGLIDAFFDGKKFAEAVRVCTELLEIKTVADGRRFSFLIEDGLGDFGFQEATDFDLVKPLRLTVHQMRIQALAKEGKLEQALKHAINLARASDGWKERQLHGMVLREMGRVAEAAKVYEDVLERIAKDDELTQKGKDRYTDFYRHVLSNVYVEAKQIDKAADLLQSLIDRHPDDAGYHNDLGYIWADNGMNLKEAEAMIRKALDLDRDKRKAAPDFDATTDKDKGSYLDSLGWVLFKQKRFEDAKKYLIEALKDKDAQHLEIFDHMGDTYMALGQRDEALDAWRRGLEVAGDDRLEKERKAEVEKKIQKHSK
jgi:tetratricopeptide (TPR) repeat protein